jgi:hypothetical protein
LIISIDFDDTFTADTHAFLEIIEILRDHGHLVLCISARLDNERNRQQLKTALPEGIEILLTSGLAKCDFASDHGFEVDIWIDDLPQDIVSHKVWENEAI